MTINEKITLSVTTLQLVFRLVTNQTYRTPDNGIDKRGNQLFRDEQ